MSEWWTYRPSDFLMFSPRIYWRLFESLNTAWWPVQLVLLTAALVWLALRLRPTQRVGTAHTAAAAVLGVCWLLTARVFLLERFAPINAPAFAYAVAFALQGAGLLALAVAAGRAGLVPLEAGARALTAVALGLWAVLGHPLLAVLAGRPFTQAELFGLAPDPTVIGTLAFLLLVQPGKRSARALWRVLWWIPVAWCVLGAATLATMGAALEAVVLVLALVAALTARWRAGSLRSPLGNR